MLSASLETNHFFEWAALSLAHIARGSRWKLYLLLCLLTIIVTIFLGNDGAILGMTAIVAKLVKRTFPNERGSWWPYVLATGFLADAFSGFLVPDNLTNIIVASTYHLPFVLFMLQMSIPMIVSAIVGIICFAGRFHQPLFGQNASYDMTLLQAPASVLQDRLVFWVSWGVLFVLISGHLIIGGMFHQPVSFVVVPVAIVILSCVQIRKPGHVQTIARAAPWEVLFYALGMFVVITAAMTPGVVDAFLSISPLQSLIAGQSTHTGVLVTGGIMGGLASLTNNLPATLVGVILLGAHGRHAPAFLAIYAILLGVDIGPKFTPYGSLATLMWMDILHKEGVKISWSQCLRENFWVTGLALAAALFVLQLVVH